MDRYLVILGLISSLIIGSLAKESVTVNRDITVKPTPDGSTDPADKVNVTLNCTGSRSDLAYYITNRIQWTFKRSRSDEMLPISLGFYVDDRLDQSKFSISYGEVVPNQDKGYFTAIKISGVTRADDGIYRCSLISGDTAVDTKNVTLTVVNPVETVSLEVHDAQHNVVASSKKALTQNAQPVNLKPGQYMVKCDASGSNPEPVMSLRLNDEQPYVSVSTMEDKTAKYTSYKGSFTVDSLTINAHNAEQALTCSANIPGDYYPSASAGLSLMVRIDKPTVVCENATAMRGDRQSKIKCNVSAGENSRALECENVHWLLSNVGVRINYDGRWKDTSGLYDMVDSKCMKTDAGLQVILTLYSIKGEAMFKEMYNLVYGKGANAHSHPITLYEYGMNPQSTSDDFTIVTVAGAGIASPLPLLACLVMALVSKHLARL